MYGTLLEYTFRVHFSFERPQLPRYGGLVLCYVHVFHCYRSARGESHDWDSVSYASGNSDCCSCGSQSFFSSLRWVSDWNRLEVVSTVEQDSNILNSQYRAPVHIPDNIALCVSCERNPPCRCLSSEPLDLAGPARLGG